MYHELRVALITSNSKWRASNLANWESAAIVVVGVDVSRMGKIARIEKVLMEQKVPSGQMLDFKYALEAQLAEQLGLHEARFVWVTGVMKQ